jgi:nucleoside-diphosphate-sugar epimerase
MISVVISGSGGFIGKHLISELSKQKIKIIKMSKIFGDISKKKTWEKLPEANVLVHLAAKTFVPESWKKPKEFFNTNVTGTKMALEYCRKYNTKIIFISSYMYGNAKKIPTSEKNKIIANNPLAKTKKKAEELCQTYAKRYGIKTIILRPSNVYGPNQKSCWLIPEIIKKIKKKTIFVNNLDIKRDMIFVHDLVRAIIKCIFLDKKFDIINIGSGNSYSIASIFKTLQKVTNKKIFIKSRNLTRKNEIMKTQLNIEKAKKLLKWKPLWSLERGLKFIIKEKKIF